MSSLQASVKGTDLNRTLGVYDLICVGIGGIIGSGIFVLTGHAAAIYAGPAVVLSFLIAGFVATMAALCYSEMAAMIPVSGSAYTYAYATLGEFVAWIIGWDLILEYLAGAAAVAVGWSGYVSSFFSNTLGVTVNPYVTNAPFAYDKDKGFYLTGAVVNLPACLVVLAITFTLIRGIKESSRINTAMVIVKLLVILLFLFSTVMHVKRSNLEPFVPPNSGTFGEFGVSGVFQGASLVFFAYIGFDAVSTTAQECKNPQRDLPIGILVSLAVCTVLYVLVSLVLTGLVPYKLLNVPYPIALGVEVAGQSWLTAIVELGAIAGLSSVLIVELMGQPRIFFSMAQDGLLPPVFARLHQTYKTPYVTTAVTGSFCALLAALFPIGILSEMTSVGTLFAFFLVCLAVPILRYRRPDLERPFKVPGGAYPVPLLGAATSFLLICTSTTQTIIRLFVWMAIGAVIYFSYGIRHSKINEPDVVAEDEADKEEKDAEHLATNSIEYFDYSQSTLDVSAKRTPKSQNGDYAQVEMVDLKTGSEV